MTYLSNVKILHFTKIRKLDQFLTSSDLMTTIIKITKKNNNNKNKNNSNYNNDNRYNNYKNNKTTFT